MASLVSEVGVGTLWAAENLLGWGGGWVGVEWGSE